MLPRLSTEVEEVISKVTLVVDTCLVAMVATLIPIPTLTLTLKGVKIHIIEEAAREEEHPETRALLLQEAMEDILPLHMETQQTTTDRLLVRKMTTMDNNPH